MKVLFGKNCDRLIVGAPNNGKFVTIKRSQTQQIITNLTYLR